MMASLLHRATSRLQGHGLFPLDAALVLEVHGRRRSQAGLHGEGVRKALWSDTCAWPAVSARSHPAPLECPSPCSTQDT